MTTGTIWKRSTIIRVIKSSVACISYNYDKSIDNGNGGDSNINCNNINACSLSINLSTSTLGTYPKTSNFHHYLVIDCIRQDNNAHYSSVVILYNFNLVFITLTNHKSVTFVDWKLLVLGYVQRHWSVSK